MVKDHSDSERGNPHGLLFLISSKGSFICTILQRGQHIPRPLLHQSWSTGWNEKYKCVGCVIKKTPCILSPCRSVILSAEMLNLSAAFFLASSSVCPHTQYLSSASCKHRWKINVSLASHPVTGRNALFNLLCTYYLLS